MILQGFLAHKQTTSPLGPPSGPRHGPAVGSQGGAFSYERGPSGSPARARLGTRRPSPRYSVWGLDVIRKGSWSFYRTISNVRLCWELEEPRGPKVKVACSTWARNPFYMNILDVTAVERAWNTYASQKPDYSLGVSPFHSL